MKSIEMHQFTFFTSDTNIDIRGLVSINMDAIQKISAEMTENFFCLFFLNRYKCTDLQNLIAQHQYNNILKYSTLIYIYIYNLYLNTNIHTNILYIYVCVNVIACFRNKNKQIIAVH